MQWKQIVSLVLVALAWCLSIGSLSINQWLDDNNFTEFEVWFGVRDFKIKKADAVFSSIEDTYGLDSDVLREIYGDNQADRFEDAGDAALACGVLAVVPLTVAALLMVINLIKPTLTWSFSVSLVLMWFSCFMMLMSMVSYVGLVRDNLEGDIGYNDSFALLCCSGIFLSCAAMLWWLGAPTVEAATWGKVKRG